MDYVIHQEGEDTIGEALTDRARAIYGTGKVIINVPASVFMDNFPPQMELGIVDGTGDLHIVTTNSLH